MGKRMLKFFLVLAAGFFFSSLNSMSFSEDSEVSAGISVQQADQTPRKEPTREDMLFRINRILKNRQSVRNEIPGAELIGDRETGYIEYNGSRVENLDTAAIKELMALVTSEARKKQMENMERLQKQMQSIQNLNRINQNLRGANIPSQPYTPPKVYTPPTAVPSTPPRIPQPPPRTR